MRIAVVYEMHAHKHNCILHVAWLCLKVDNQTVVYPVRDVHNETYMWVAEPTHTMLPHNRKSLCPGNHRFFIYNARTLIKIAWSNRFDLYSTINLLLLSNILPSALIANLPSVALNSLWVSDPFYMPSLSCCHLLVIHTII